MSVLIKTSIACGIFVGIVACSNSSFSGGGKKSGGKGGDQNPQTPGASSSGVPKSALDSNGAILESCKDIKPLPKDTVQLKEILHWVPTGALAAYSQVVTTPIVGKLNKSDSVPTILVVGFTAAECGSSAPKNAYLFAIDGKTGAQKWNSSFKVLSWVSPAIGDLDGDGSLEIAMVGDDNLLHLLNADGSAKWTSTNPVYANPAGVYSVGGKSVYWASAISMADLAGDGKPSVIAAGNVYDGATGKLKYSVPSSFSFSAVSDTNGAPGLEVVTDVGIFNGNDGSKICSFAESIQDPAIAKLRASDDHSVVIGTTDSKVIVYDGKDCSQLSSQAKTMVGGSVINISDFDGDGVLDFGTAGLSKYIAFAFDKILWSAPTQDKSSSVTGSTSFDFNGSGKNEVVYGDETTLWVFDGTTGHALYSAPHSSYTMRETPIVVDTDGNGTANIVVGNNVCSTTGTGAVTGLLTGIQVFSAPDDDWVGTRPIWNQIGYNPLLVNDDGGLVNIDPKSIALPWLKSPHLAGFRNNIPHVAIKQECK